MVTSTINQATIECSAICLWKKDTGQADICNAKICIWSMKNVRLWFLIQGRKQLLDGDILAILITIVLQVSKFKI